MNKKTAILFVLLCLTLTQFSWFKSPCFNGISPTNSSTVTVYAQSPSNETITNETLSHALVFNHPCYKPAKIVLNFPYTHDHDITQITTIGPSMYQTEGGPTTLTFNAFDIDVYTFRVTLRYDNATDRTVTISLWSGTYGLMEGYTWSMASQTFVIDFRIEVREEPHYPSKDEVAEEVFNKNAQLLVNLTQKYEAVMRDIQSANFTNSLMTAVTVGLVIVVLLLMAFTYRKRRVRAED